MSDFNITLFEACELLNRSKKSISRYIRRGLLHPQQIKSQQGTLEYRFGKADIEAFKAQEAQKADETRETEHIKTTFIENKELLDDSRQDTPEQIGQGNEIINLLKETTGLLKDQLKVKDEQIKDLGGKIDQLIERSRETNILIGQLQSKVLMLEKPKEPINGDITEQTRQDTPDKTGQDKAIKPLKEKKTKQAKPKAEVKTPEKKGFWKRLFKSEL